MNVKCEWKKNDRMKNIGDDSILREYGGSWHMFLFDDK